MVGPQGWLLKFAQYMKTQGFSQRSIPDYLRNVRLFLEYLKGLGIDNLADVDRKLTFDYQLSVSTEQRDGHPLPILRSATGLPARRRSFATLVRSSAVIYDPTTDVQLPRIRDQIPAGVLSKREVAQLLSESDLQTATGVRDRALLELLYSAGIRVSKLPALDLEDLGGSGARLHRALPSHLPALHGHASASKPRRSSSHLGDSGAQESGEHQALHSREPGGPERDGEESASPWHEGQGRSKMP